MSRWVGVVQHNLLTGDRIGKTLINLDNVDYIETTRDVLVFNSGEHVKINRESMVHILELLEME